MIFFGYDVRVEYLPIYVAIPIAAVLVVISGYLVWWLIHGTWPAIFFLLASVMGIVETWDKTRKKKGKMVSIRKIDSL